MSGSTGGSGNGGGHRAADSLRRIGSVFNAPSRSFTGFLGGAGGRVDFGDLLGFVGDAFGEAPPPDVEALPDEPRKLPPRAEGAADAAWQGLAPIAERDPARCPDGPRDLGVVLFVHDVEEKRRDFAERSDADRWQAVHNISDLIEGLRAMVGDCGTVRGIMISSHGGFANHGGFRMGDDDDGDGDIESGEANDLVSTPAQAADFGRIIRGALAADNGFIAVEACSSAGPGNAFLQALHGATAVTVIGAPDKANVGGGYWSGAWWTASAGRAQIAADGTAGSDPATGGTGVWRPF